jgi:hypothetical protein
MNTMPQVFDARPLPQAGFAVSRTALQPRRVQTKSGPRLTLVMDQTEVAGEAAIAAVAIPASISRPYGLHGRRHLANVPSRQWSTAGAAQAHPAQADNTGMAFPRPRRRLEPLAFALVLLVSVAALAVANRAG